MNIIVKEECPVCCQPKRYICSKIGCYEFDAGTYSSYSECVEDFLSGLCSELEHIACPTSPML